ncbi:MAG: bifunctional UDP-3-O-[3-hydroxymyristoyl] N-acetylglucosamine deacetylase/3-hydroxyacyl-ACP dehydratase [Saprospiraceae bacterium]|nr:bifunctional UDP-3-O-[3-hydroxymyristoyl] N-acetylglucosamine deacetylase/3-hydroxyacyl-ACP dehydratase [Saprospiraceae bacterium]
MPELKSVNSNQRTIVQSCKLDGIGLHTGEHVTMTFHAAEPGYGIRFRRVDLPNQPVLGVDVGKVVSTNRGTTIKEGAAQVSTVEHVLAALAGLCIDNVLIDIDGPEVAIIDGSAQPFVEILQSAGIEQQDFEREYFIVEEPISFRDEVSGTEIVALPHDGFEVTAMIDFDSPILGKQYASLSDIHSFDKDIAPARTFVFLRELEHLYGQDLIKGGDLENAVVIVDRLITQDELDVLAKKLGKPKMKVDKEGVLNNTDLRYRNEPARHKLLDLIGDLALIGRPIKGKIMATKPGHAANVAFARLLREQYKLQRKLKGKPRYDPNNEPILDVEGVKKMLPHRYPFLLVDKIVELSEDYVVGIKNITYQEHVFQGHFPNNPVFPGVMIVEALAQTGGILALSNVDDPTEWDTYFLKIENTKFKFRVVPGDTLILKMELLSPIRRGIVHMQGTAYVGNKIVAEGELTAQIINRTKL